jgi:hypothetical protein
MPCLRCGGLMIQDDFFELRESHHRLTVWRCVLCGEMVDPVIAANRRRHTSGVESLSELSDHRSPLRPLTRAA